MGCGQGKTSAPQVSTQRDQQKTLLSAPQTPCDINPTKEHQSGTLTNANVEDPNRNAPTSVASVEETVQEQSKPNAQRNAAAVKEIAQEQHGILTPRSRLAISLDNTLASGELASIIASMAGQTLSAVEPAYQDDASMQMVSGLDASKSNTATVATSDQGLVGKDATSQSSVSASGSNVQIDSTRDHATESSLPTVKDTTPSGSAGRPRKERNCGCC